MNVNLYPILIALFIAVGLFHCIREWRKIKNGKNAEPWPSVEGSIEKSIAYDPLNKTQPLITYSYQVDGSTYTGKFNFPPDTEVMPELSKPFVEKYSKNSRVDVFYNPQEFGQSTLEAKQYKDNWLIFGIGVLSVIVGTFFLFF